MRWRESLARLAMACAMTMGCLAAAWNAWPTLIDWHQHWLAGKFVQRIAAASDDAVRLPLRQLASLGIPALRPLVEEAASRRAAVARVARQVLDEKFATWQLQAQASEDFQLALPLKTLAAALADNIHRFGPAGKQWAERQTLQILLIAKTVPPDAAPTLLDDCSRVLAAVPPRGPRTRNPSPATSLRTPANSRPLPNPALKLDVLAVPSEHAIRTAPGTAPHVDTQDPQGGENKAAGTVDSVPPQLLLPPPPSSVVTGWSRRSGSAPRAATSHGFSSSVPQTNENHQHADSAVIDVPTPPEMESQLTELRQVPSRQLLDRLAQAQYFQAEAVRAVLRERGFVDAEFELARRLTSSSAADRLQLIDDLSRLSAASARRWLRWLLEDANADVRLRALTAMATTRDPQLFDLARRLAVTDQDPRIAELASRIMRQAR